MKHLPLFEGWVLQHLEDQYDIQLELWDRGDYLQLDKIIIPKDRRGEGLGSKVMQQIINFADRSGKDIRLTPDTSFGATSVSRLTRFYQGFGFVKNRDYQYRESLVRYYQP